MNNRRPGAVRGRHKEASSEQAEQKERERVRNGDGDSCVLGRSRVIRLVGVETEVGKGKSLQRSV